MNILHGTEAACFFRLVRLVKQNGVESVRTSFLGWKIIAIVWTPFFFRIVRAPRFFLGT